MPNEGGNAQIPKVNPSIGTKTCSLIAVPKKGLRKPDIFEATNIDEFTKATKEDFNFEFKKSNGSLVKEVYTVEDYQDIELEAISQKSEVLREQEYELTFLREFVNKWRKDSNFRVYFIEMLKDESRREQTIKALKLIQFATQKKQIPAPFIQLMNEI